MAAKKKRSKKKVSHKRPHHGKKSRKYADFMKQLLDGDIEATTVFEDENEDLEYE